MDEKLSIRLMSKDDLKPLAAIYCRVYASFDVGEKWDEKSARDLLSYWLRRQPDLCFVAEYDNRVVGAFVAGIKPWCDGNHLVDGEIFVDPDCQRKRVGTELSKVMYKTAIKRYNAKCFDAITFRTPEFPLSWYKSQGFKEVDNWVVISGKIRSILANLESVKT